MNKQSQDALASVERIVFQCSNPVVVALTGGWGEGKTHFWRKSWSPATWAKDPVTSQYSAQSLSQ